MITQNRYSISELAEAAKVSPRTIRYYTEIGLLPQPEMDGKYTVYDEHHLDRLKLIAHLKSSYLPLKEISKYMAGKTDDEIAVEVNSTRVEKVDNDDLFFRSFERRAELSSASDYLRSVLSPGDENQGDVLPSPSVDQFELSNEVSPRSGGSILRDVAPSPSMRPERLGGWEQKEEWERYTLQEGIELHVRRSIDQNTRTRVETLLDLAKKLFRGKPRGRNE